MRRRGTPARLHRRSLKHASTPRTDPRIRGSSHPIPWDRAPGQRTFPLRIGTTAGSEPLSRGHFQRSRPSTSPRCQFVDQNAQELFDLSEEALSAERQPPTAESSYRCYKKHIGAHESGSSLPAGAVAPRATVEASQEEVPLRSHRKPTHGSYRAHRAEVYCPALARECSPRAREQYETNYPDTDTCLRRVVVEQQ